jgi:hypothetical protein
VENLKLWLPLIYVVIAIATWLNFVRLPPDGLASVGLWIVVFPVLILDLVLRPSGKPGTSIFLPDGHGYYLNHAIFFSVSVVLIAVCLFGLGAMLDRR